MENEPDKWHWQKSGTAWKGIGIYHVTMVIPSRKPLLGELVIPENDPAQARVERTELGRQIIGTLAQIPKFHPEIRILQYCLMPDHLHSILYVTRPMSKGIMTAVRGFWQGAKKIGRAHSAAILSVKSNSIRINKENDDAPNDIRDNGQNNNDDPNGIRDNERKSDVDPVFTEMPFVRPMSRRGQLQTMFRYIRMNPQRLATKRLRPGFFRVQRDIEIGNHTYDAVGNIAILMEKRRETVHVRRAMVEAAAHGEDKPLRDYMNGCVIAARENAVMVSPFISPKEKEVLDVIIKEQHLVIYLSDNGFGEYYKPSDACLTAWQQDECSF